MVINLVEYDRIFLTLSWLWLNDPEIKVLTDTPDFSKESQERWFESLCTIDNYLIWGITVDDIPIGVCGLKNITKDNCEYWGYIGDKAYWGKGIGKYMVEKLEMKAMDLNLRKIYLKVLITNERAIKLYNRMGYVVVASDEKELFMEKCL